MKKRVNSWAVGLIALLLLAAALVAVPYLFQGWRYFFTLGRTGLWLRLAVAFGAILLYVGLGTLVLARARHSRKKEPDQSVNTRTVRILTFSPSGKALIRQEEHTQARPSSGARPHLAFKKLAGRVIVVVLLFTATTLFGLDAVPTMQDLSSEPVTETYYARIQYSGSSTSFALYRGYYLACYNEAGDIKQRIPLSRLEPLQNQNGDTVFDVPMFTPILPRSSDFGYFIVTVTYYPHTKTRQALSLQSIPQEQFPAGALPLTPL